jgi:hypothetical protein
MLLLRGDSDHLGRFDDRTEQFSIFRFKPPVATIVVSHENLVVWRANESATAFEDDLDNRLNATVLNVAESLQLDMRSVKRPYLRHNVRSHSSVKLAHVVLPKRPSDPLAATIDSHNGVTGNTSGGKAQQCGPLAGLKF